MNKDRITLYSVCAICAIVIFLAALVPNDTASNVAIGLTTALSAAVMFFCIKKRFVHSHEKKQVALVVGAIAVIGISVYYATGISLGYREVLIAPSHLWKYIIPYAVVIVSSEFIRSTVLDQKRKLLSVLLYIALVVLDVALFTETNAIEGFKDFTELVAWVLFPSLASNLLYHHLSAKYGMLPPTVYRLIVVLYSYIIPFEPIMPDAMFAFVRTCLPIGVYLIITKMYAKRKFTASRRSVILKATSGVLTFVLLASIVMLVSCQFRFGLLVIGSESMTGEIDKGDAVIYEQYSGEIVEAGQVILFEKDDMTVIHRVIDVQKIDGVIRYYTKGDANESADSGYITAENIVGISRLKIKYVGYPTVWLREVFK